MDTQAQWSTETTTAGKALHGFITQRHKTMDNQAQRSTETTTAGKDSKVSLRRGTKPWTFRLNGPLTPRRCEEIEYYVTETAVEGYSTTVTLGALGYRRRKDS